MKKIPIRGVCCPQLANYFAANEVYLAWARTWAIGGCACRPTGISARLLPAVILIPTRLRRLPTLPAAWAE
jgi:hypothetical protein